MRDIRTKANINEQNNTKKLNNKIVELETKLKEVIEENRKLKEELSRSKESKR